MGLKQRIDQDLKASLLAGNQQHKVLTLRSLKGVILNEEVAKGLRDEGLSDEVITQLLAKEAKRRQESADIYRQGGDEARAAQELEEKSIIETYLPQQLTEVELRDIINAIADEVSAEGLQAMGQIIGKTKQQVGAAADGALIARLVQERLKGNR